MHVLKVFRLLAKNMKFTVKDSIVEKNLPLPNECLMSTGTLIFIKNILFPRVWAIKMKVAKASLELTWLLPLWQRLVHPEHSVCNNQYCIGLYF